MLWTKDKRTWIAILHLQLSWDSEWQKRCLPDANNRGDKDLVGQARVEIISKEEEDMQVDQAPPTSGD